MSTVHMGGSHGGTKASEEPHSKFSPWIRSLKKTKHWWLNLIDIPVNLQLSSHTHTNYYTVKHKKNNNPWMKLIFPFLQNLDPNNVHRNANEWVMRECLGFHFSVLGMSPFCYRTNFVNQLIREAFQCSLDLNVLKKQNPLHRAICIYLLQASFRKMRRISYHCRQSRAVCTLNTLNDFTI